MNFAKQPARIQRMVLLTGALFMLAAAPGSAQDYAPPPSYTPQQLDNLVSRVALYPDPLLAQVLAAATYPDQIQDAARWTDAHRNFSSADLEDAVQRENPGFDPSVLALLPFASVIDTMASDMNWTAELGDAVLVDRGAVMDAVQRMRRQAENYGYLQSSEQVRVVSTATAIEILPYDPAIIYVPVYDPYIVYAPPRPGYYGRSVIRFSPGFAITAGFRNWGWGGGFNWHSHALVVHNTPWQRTWGNRPVAVRERDWNRGRQGNVQQQPVIVNNNNVNVNDRRRVETNVQRTFENTNRRGTDNNNGRTVENNNHRTVDNNNQRAIDSNRRGVDNNHRVATPQPQVQNSYSGNRPATAAPAPAPARAPEHRAEPQRAEPQKQDSSRKGDRGRDR